MKIFLVLLILSVAALAMAGAAVASPVSNSGTTPVGVDKDLGVTVTIDPAIYMDTLDARPPHNQQDSLDFGRMNPLDDDYGWEDVDIVVKSNRPYRKDIGPGALTGMATGYVIEATRLSLRVDGKDIKNSDNGWTFDGSKYWSPWHEIGESNENLSVDLTVLWADPADTYNGTLEVSASQL